MSTFSGRAYMVLTILAVVAMAGIVLYDLVAPKPQAISQLVRNRTLSTVKDNISVEQQQLDSAKSFVARYVWSADTDAVTGHSMNVVTASAKAHHVQMLAFRPQKTAKVHGLVELPYLVLLSGGFSNVYAVLRDIESSANRLAIDMVQFSSANETSDDVNATISVVALQNPPKETSNATAK